MTNDLQQARVEAAMRAYRDHRGGEVRGKMRAVLAAADAHLPTVEQIETRIKEAEYDWRNADFVGDPDLGTLTKYVAHAVLALFRGGAK